MPLLTSKHLVVQIKARQSREFEQLRQKFAAPPRLAIVVTIDNPVTNTYLRMKQAYGADLGVTVDVHRVAQSELPALINQLNADKQVQAIIIQLPLAQPEATETMVHLVVPQKDVDGLGSTQYFEPATPLAILWLLQGHGITLSGKHVVLVGRGKLVGAPLERMLIQAGITPTVLDIHTKDVKAETLKADVLITATGHAGLIRPDMVKPGAVVVDAGVAGEKGKTVGDVAPEVYERDDLTLTPSKGGVGPLTVCALFENVLHASALTAQ